ncbi:MAG: ArnT family glycosyltransferase [Phototrophicaceae bacterium]
MATYSPTFPTRLLATACLVIGVLCLTAATEISAGFLGWPLEGVSIHIQHGLWLAGCILSISGLIGRSGTANTEGLPVVPSEAFALALILLAAFLLRVWHTQSALRLSVDENAMMQAIMEMRAKPTLRLLVPITVLWPHPWVFPYWQWMAAEGFGYGFVALRLPSAVLGTFAVGATAWLGRALFQDRRVGVGAALILATLPAHMHFSRLGLPNIADASFGVCAIAALVTAIRHRDPRAWILSGACLALTHYFYEGGRLFFTPLVILVVGGLWWAKRPQFDGRGVRLALLAFGLLVAPVYLVRLAYHAPLTQRLGEVRLTANDWANVLLASGDHLETYAERFSRPLRLWVGMPDQSPHYRGQAAPLWGLGLFWVGVLALIQDVRHGRRAGALLLLWLGLNIGGDFLVLKNGQLTRYILSMPVLALLIAFGAVRLIGWLTARWRLSAWRVLPIVFGILACAGVTHYWALDLPTLKTVARQERIGRDLEDVVWRVMALPSGTTATIITQPPFDLAYHREILAYLDAQDARRTLNGAWTGEIPGYYEAMQARVRSRIAPHYRLLDYTAQLQISPPYAVFVEPQDSAARKRLQVRFGKLPAPQISPFELAPDEMMLLYYWPP